MASTLVTTINLFDSSLFQRKICPPEYSQWACPSSSVINSPGLNPIFRIFKFKDVYWHLKVMSYFIGWIEIPNRSNRLEHLLGCCIIASMNDIIPFILTNYYSLDCQCFHLSNPIANP